MSKTLRMIRRLTLVSLVAWSLSASAGTITGKIVTATGGPIKNATVTYTLSQPAYLSGTGIVATNTVSCATDATGTMVGLPNPLTAPSLSTNTASGTLPAATYYVKITYWVGSTETAASPEAVKVLSSQGTLIVASPAVQPSNATGYKVYISSSTGTETLQATVTGWGSYSQSTALAAGTALPASNSTVCSLYFSDQLVPTGTAYSVNVRTSTGSQIAGFPQNWCTYGGAGGTIDISTGTPNGQCGARGVFYPTPILANSVNMQSVAGSFGVGGDLNVTGALTVGSFNLSGTLNLTSIGVTSMTVNGNTITAAPGSNTITLPSTSTTLIGANTTETLSNKTLSAPLISAATISSSTINSSSLAAPTITSPVINTGIPGDSGSGFKHKRLSTGSISASTTTPIAFTWTTPFADTNYTAVCSVEDAANQLTIASAISAKLAAGFTISVKNNDAGGAHTGTLACIGIHD